MLNSTLCHVCKGPLDEFERFREFSRVTSDCRPWGRGGRLAACLDCGLVQKAVDDDFRRDCESIYGGYCLYFQGSGEEQRIFDQETGASLPRSELIIRRLEEVHELPQRGRLLDVGCGAGHFLRSFAKRYPSWRLWGMDVDPKYKEDIGRICGAEGFVSDLTDCNAEFDLIVINHAFEHIVEPVGLLDDLSRKLGAGGVLLLDVPYHPDNPFDLLIADHCSHFSEESLKGVLQRAGMSLQFVSSAAIRKEMLALVCSGTDASDEAGPSDSRQVVEALLGWLDGFSKTARTARDASSFGIFGTAIAAAWTFGMLDGNVDFFVDEDVNRAGHEFLGRPVYRPSEVPRGSNLFIAFPQPTAGQIAARLEALPLCFYVPDVLLPVSAT